METRIRPKLPALPRDPLAKSPEDVAVAFEKNVGVPGSVNVTVSRERLRNLLGQSVRLGAEWQRSTQEAELAQKQAADLAARPAFPPRRMAVGIYRLRVVAAAIAAGWWLWVSWRRLGRGCYRVEPGGFEEFLCLGDGLMGGAVAAGMVFLAATAGLWAVNRVVLWVWRGFRGT